MTIEDFVDKMSIYFNEELLNKLTITSHDSEYFKDAILKVNNVSSELRILSVNRGKYGTNYSEPYIIIAFNDSGLDKYLSEVSMQLNEIDDTKLLQLDSLIYGVRIKYTRKDTTMKSKDKFTRAWLNKVFRILNKNYGVRIKMLRTW